MSHIKKTMLSLALLTVSAASWAQNALIHGMVIDEQNEPVIGATIKVDGTTTGAVTDLDGNFTIEAGKDATLSISYIGYSTQQVRPPTTSTRWSSPVIRCSARLTSRAPCR